MGDWLIRPVQPAPLDTNEQRLAITEIINHPDYIYNLDNTMKYDIAVIKVNGSFDCRTDSIFPVCLPNLEVTALIMFFLLSSFIQICRVPSMLVGRTPLSQDGAQLPTYMIPCSGWRFLYYQTPLVTHHWRGQFVRAILRLTLVLVMGTGGGPWWPGLLVWTLDTL